MSISMMKVRVGILCVAVVVCSACATTHRSNPWLASQRATEDNDAVRLGPSAYRLTANEIIDSRVTSTAEAVRHLRPEFLRATSTPTLTGVARVQPSVFLNGDYAGGPEVLETIPLAAIEEISLIHAAQAHSRWGASCQCAGGVILVRTKKR